MKKEDEEKVDSVFMFMLIFVICLTAFLVWPAEFEGDCKFTNVNFEVNDTGDFKGLELNNSDIECSFKGSVPNIHLLRE